MEEGQRGQHVVYVTTLKDLLYNDFIIGGNGGSGSLRRGFLDFLGHCYKLVNYL